MVSIYARDCSHQDCATSATYGVEGERATFCSYHAKAGMVYRLRKKTCNTAPNFGITGTTRSQKVFAKDTKGMARLHHRRCSHPNCTKSPL